MNRIIINEQDITSNETTNRSSDIVYVPGFASGGTQQARVPKMCSSISEFEDAFGSSPAQFIVDQVYPLKTASTAGFTELAIPEISGADRIWYNSGTLDPSYIYAKELIRNGLSVVYERVNMVTDVPSFRPTLYSNTATYEVGDYVVHSGAYYECKTAISTPEEWTASKWDAVPTEGEGAVPWYDVTVERMYDVMMGDNLNEGENALFDENVPGSLSEISTYNIKYITSGGYPTFEYEKPTSATESISLSQIMATLAATRGDAIAFIDHTDNAARPLTGDNSVYGQIANHPLSNTTDLFATMITPWGVYATSESKDTSLPGSFHYFMALARALRAYPSWLPVAGVVRGLIPSLKYLNTNNVLTNAIADSYQPDPTTQGGVSINAVTYINDQGYTIWGNRTLKSQDPSQGFATTFLNMRNLICDVKKQAFKSAQQYMFEQNTDILWINFKNSIQKLLDQMASGNVINRYKIIKLSTPDKTKIAAKIQIVPIYAVESFEISIVMTDEEITVE